MKKRQQTASGTIDSNGRLSMYMGELNEFFKQHKGKRVVAVFDVAEPGSSEALKVYYYNCVVPTMMAAIWESGERKSQEDTEKYLRELSPIAKECTPLVDICQYNTRLKEVAEFSNYELIEHILS